jgi:hypothetical protein
MQMRQKGEAMIAKKWDMEKIIFNLGGKKNMWF